MNKQNTYKTNNLLFGIIKNIFCQILSLNLTRKSIQNIFANTEILVTKPLQYILFVNNSIKCNGSEILVF